MVSYWRKIARPLIAEIISQGLSSKAQRKALIQAYPFGERARWPYKIWLDEIKRQRGLKSKLYKSREGEIPDPNQLKLFKK